MLDDLLEAVDHAGAAHWPWSASEAQVDSMHDLHMDGTH